LIKGIEVILYVEIVIGYDEFGTEITEKTPQKVQDVLVSPASAQEILDNNELYGRKAVYTLAIPKDDICLLYTFRSPGEVEKTGMRFLA